MPDHWERLPALSPREAGLRSGSLTCGPQPFILDMEDILGVGFGCCELTRDGVMVWEQGKEDGVTRDLERVAMAEGIARDDPDHDWRIFYNNPLSDALYQRQGDSRWVLVRRGMGFW